MIIIDKTRCKKFSDVNTGAVFVFEGECFMKTSIIPARLYNAVCLNDGVLAVFSEGDYIYEKSAELFLCDIPGATSIATSATPGTRADMRALDKMLREPGPVQSRREPSGDD